MNENKGHESDTGFPPQFISTEAISRVGTYNIRIRDQVKIVCELARENCDKKLTQQADSLEHLIRKQTFLVDGIIEAMSLDNQE